MVVAGSCVYIQVDRIERAIRDNQRAKCIIKTSAITYHTLRGKCSLWPAVVPPTSKPEAPVLTVEQRRRRIERLQTVSASLRL